MSKFADLSPTKLEVMPSTDIHRRQSLIPDVDEEAREVQDLVGKSCTYYTALSDVYHSRQSASMVPQY